MEEKKRVNVKQNESSLTEKDGLEAIQSWPQHTLAQRVSTRELPTPIMNVIPDKVRQSWKVSGNASVGEDSQSKKFHHMTKDYNRFVKEEKAYKMESDKIEKPLIEKEVDMTSMMWSLAKSGKDPHCSFDDKNLCWWRPTENSFFARCGKRYVAVKLRKEMIYILSVFLRFAFYV